jgi:amidophosphoribosyltransferase
MSYYGLHALQHRGEESAGICVADGRDFNYHRGMGLVKEVFDKDRIASLIGDMSIGHVRYSTSGDSRLTNAQPLVFKYRDGDLAIATNGNIVNEPLIRKSARAKGLDLPDYERYRGASASDCAFAEGFCRSD